MTEKALIKFNGGELALLCSKCRVIVKTGKSFTPEEIAFARGEGYLPPLFCRKCQRVKNHDPVPVPSDVVAQHRVDLTGRVETQPQAERVVSQNGDGEEPR
jgi:hypothetical protein